MKEMTEQNLKAAFAGESQAHMRYLAFADRAEEEGRPNIARLFRAIARAEQVHATGHLKALAGMGQTPANLSAAFGGETFEITEMYPAYLEVAKLQQELGAQQSMTYALQAEKLHAALYERAQAAAGAGQDLQLGELYVCPVCGHTVEDDPPERCPVCATRAERFMRFA